MYYQVPSQPIPAVASALAPLPKPERSADGNNSYLNDNVIQVEPHVT